ncbi:MAG: adenosylmethionine--8-amino-7-oxononanoate transaminase [Gemmatimonadota bacterium]|nr:adenosylmethionine--8-amino-7-oxononanoate transaminase [Gemmatimonadota bacterium]
MTSHPNVWYPFTPIEGMATPLKVVGGRGARVVLEDGRELLDCISSWWVTLHGHGHPAIADAIHAQALELEHVIFAGFTHEPAERLAEALADMLPGDLSRVFFSDDGSTAVEVALKMAYQYWVNRSESRQTFLAFEGAYHGDTVGAMSVGAESAFTGVFGELLFDVERLPFPSTWIGDEGAPEREAEVLETLRARLAATDRPVAGVIAEPLVQGAGGMRMCRADFLRGVRAATAEAGTLLILDEVMTGFGRTGARFACERAGVAPDLICLSKGLTGGFLPLAVTVASERVYQAFVSREAAKTFWHGHSYTANPLGCAAALASLELLRENAEAFQGMEAHHRAFLARLDPALTERPRVTGTIAAFDVRTRGTGGYFDDIGDEIKRRTVDKGLLLRPLGSTLYLMPPYCVTDEEREQMYAGVLGLVRDVMS